MNPTRTRLTMALAGVALLAGAACADGTPAVTTKASTPTTSSTTASPAAAWQPTYLSTEIPDSPAGRQLGWMLEAARHLPIPAPLIEEHFSAGFLAQFPPDQLNALLTPSGDPQSLRFLGVLAQTPSSLDAALDPGAGQPRQVFAVAVDGDGRVAGLRGKPFPVGPRSARGLGPVSLPRPSGPSPVGQRAIVATDAARPGRRIPVDLWYPAKPGPARPARYALPATAARLAEELAVSVEDVVSVKTNALASPKVATSGRKLPVVLFSPGAGVNRLLYSGLSADLASHGYLVAVLEHPGETQPVEFPDGTVAPPVPVDSEDGLLALLPTRVADVRSVLAHLKKMNSQTGSPLRAALDLDRVALAGHSLGGATAAEAMRLDRRFRAGVNLDGTLFGDVVATGVDRPFLLMSSGRPEEPEEDDTWVPFEKASAAAQSLHVDGTAHMDFSDLPALTALRPAGEPRQAYGLGTLAPGRSFALQSTYVLAFLDRHLRGEAAPLLDGPSAKYPEVQFR